MALIRFLVFHFQPYWVLSSRLWFFILCVLSFYNLFVKINTLPPSLSLFSLNQLLQNENKKILSVLIKLWTIVIIPYHTLSSTTPPGTPLEYLNHPLSPFTTPKLKIIICDLLPTMINVLSFYNKSLVNKHFIGRFLKPWTRFVYHNSHSNICCIHRLYRYYLRQKHISLSWCSLRKHTFTINLAWRSNQGNGHTCQCMSLSHRMIPIHLQKSLEDWSIYMYQTNHYPFIIKTKLDFCLS